MISIANKALWHFAGPEQDSYGGEQAWYTEKWQRKAGCGPTVGANMIWYLARTRPELAPLWPGAGTSRADLLRLMQTTWGYITPTAMGVNKVAILREGLERYGQDRGLALRTRVLEVPPLPCPRPNYETVKSFLVDAIGADRPVAFLNLSNGALTRLDNWHWVTLIAIDPMGSAVTMMDQGRLTEIDLELWLRTTNLGGGFVWADGAV